MSFVRTFKRVRGLVKRFNYANTSKSNVTVRLKRRFRKLRKKRVFKGGSKNSENENKKAAIRHTACLRKRLRNSKTIRHVNFENEEEQEKLMSLKLGREIVGGCSLKLGRKKLREVFKGRFKAGFSHLR